MACQTWLWFVVHGRNTVSFPGWCTHMWTSVQCACMYTRFRHAQLSLPHTHTDTHTHSGSRACDHLNSSPVVSPQDISISIMLSEEINTQQPESRRRRRNKQAFFSHSHPSPCNALPCSRSHVADKTNTSQRCSHPLHGEKIHLLESVSM